MFWGFCVPWSCYKVLSNWKPTFLTLVQVQGCVGGMIGTLSETKSEQILNTIIPFCSLSFSIVNFLSEFQVLKLFPDGEGERENEKKNNKGSLWKLSETESKHKVIQESLLPSPTSWLYYQAYGLRLRVSSNLIPIPMLMQLSQYQFNWKCLQIGRIIQ